MKPDKCQHSVIRMMTHQYIAMHTVVPSAFLYKETSLAMPDHMETETFCSFNQFLCCQPRLQPNKKKKRKEQKTHNNHSDSL